MSSLLQHQMASTCTKIGGIYYYLKGNFKIESKMLSKYLPDKEEIDTQDEKEKEKAKCDEQSLIDYITEDFTCTITCEVVSDLYQLSSRVFLLLERLTVEARLEKMKFILTPANNIALS